MRRYFTSLPVEVYETITKYLAEDIQSLRNVSLVCQDLRTIAQSILFSSVVFTGEEDVDRLFSTLRSKHSGILSHIHTLTLIKRGPTEWLTDIVNGSAPGLFKLIAERAKELRAIQIGPFYFQQYATEDEKDIIDSPPEGSEVEFDWPDSPGSITTLLSEVFPRLEKIVLEDIWSVPAEEVQQWRRVKTLQVPSTALVIGGSLGSPRPRRFPEDQGHPLPAPTALTVSGDGDLHEEIYKWRGYSINFEKIRDLRIELVGEGEYHLFNTIVQACHHELESLRVFVCREPRDVVLNLSRLSSLKSLYLIIYDLASPVKALSKILNSLNVHDLPCLKELCIYIYVDRGRRNDWLLQIIEGEKRKQHKAFWRMINKKLAEIFEAKKIMHVSLALPPSDDLSWDRIVDYIHEVMPSTKDQSFHLKDTQPRSKATFQTMFTRHDERALNAIRRQIEDQCRIPEY